MFFITPGNALFRYAFIHPVNIASVAPATGQLPTSIWVNSI
ncbi:hypothetical protein [Leeia speluncae]|nr:hypothetical protein [Leeia speluncae]